MAEPVRRRGESKRVVIPPESEIARIISEAEAEGHGIELVCGESRYQLVPITGGIEDVEIGWRRVMAARARAIRDRQQPLGITTAQLVREARGEHIDG